VLTLNTRHYLILKEALCVRPFVRWSVGPSGSYQNYNFKNKKNVIKKYLLYFLKVIIVDLITILHYLEVKFEYDYFIFFKLFYTKMSSNFDQN